MGWSLYLNGDWIDSKYPQMVPDLLHFKELVWIDNYWYFCTIGELCGYYLIGGYELMSLGVLSMVLAVHGESMTNSVVQEKTSVLLKELLQQFLLVIPKFFLDNFRVTHLDIDHSIVSSMLDVMHATTGFLLS